MKPHRATLLIAAGLTALAGARASAQEALSFKDKTITMIIPTTAGAGTDHSARLFGKFFTKYLPGSPTYVASNLPSGHGTAAMNYLVQQAKPDGLTVVTASTSQADPTNYRTPQSKYDATEFVIIGAVGLGDNAMMIRRAAVPRLLDKTKVPVTMGSVSGIPRTGMNMAVWGIEFLGWNARWVLGYPGSADLVLALERDEIDMTSFPKTYLPDKLTDMTKYQVLYQEGLTSGERPSPRKEINEAPIFTEAMKGKITDPKVERAYDEWRANILMKWVALPPKTPAPIRDAYRAAFARAVEDPEFKTQAEISLPGFTVLPAAETEEVIRQLAKSGSSETAGVMEDLMRKQGINVQAGAQAQGRE